MIETLSKSNKKELEWLAYFCNELFDYDFYFTKDNSRIFISNLKNLKMFMKECREVYVLKDKGDYQGVITTWKSFGAGKDRDYVKVNAKNVNIARDLITILTWNSKKDLFVKIRKDSKFVNAFKSKGFKFIGGRGMQILLKRKAKIFNFVNFKDKE